MQPIRATVDAINELGPFVDDADLMEKLTTRADQARALVPDCIGVSVASRELGLTFTLVATSEEIATLHGAQRPAGQPPGQTSGTDHRSAATLEDVLTESAWRSSSQASAAIGIRCTLTFPIMEGENAVGSVHLYGCSEDAFAGRHAALAEVFRAWAHGAVTNADLSFSTRVMAEQAPQLLRDEATMAVATGILAAFNGTDVEEAQRRLEEASLRAGLTVIRLAEIIVGLRAR